MFLFYQKLQQYYFKLFVFNCNTFKQNIAFIFKICYKNIYICKGVCCVNTRIDYTPNVFNTSILLSRKRPSKDTPTPESEILPRHSLNVFKFCESAVSYNVL